MGEDSTTVDISKDGKSSSDSFHSIGFISPRLGKESSDIDVVLEGGGGGSGLVSSFRQALITLTSNNVTGSPVSFHKLVKTRNSI